MPSEASFYRRAKEALGRHGYRVHRLDERGYPDLLAVHPGKRACYIEVKKDSRTYGVSPSQAMVIEYLRMDGFHVVVWDVSGEGEAEFAERVISGGTRPLSSS